MKHPEQANHLQNLVARLAQFWANEICICRHRDVNSWSQLGTNLNGSMYRIREEVADEVPIDGKTIVHCHQRLLGDDVIKSWGPFP